MHRRDFLGMGAQAAAALTLASPGRQLQARPRFGADPFSLGVASGYPTDESVVLWTRLAPHPQAPNGGIMADAIEVRWEVATDAGMRRVIRRGTERATAAWGFSVHAEPRGLDAAREYWYRFTAGDAQSAIGRTRTLPRRSSGAGSLRLAVASCQQYEHGYYAAYRHMLDDELDLVLHLGDYIYELSWGERRVRDHAGPETFTLDDYRRRYALYRGDPDLAAAHAAYPWLLSWDDHEVDNDYAGDQSELLDDRARFLERRTAAYQAFYEHMPLPKAARPEGQHLKLYAQRTVGGLANLLMLDGRQYRSPQACPREGRGGANRVSDCAALAERQRSMLGARQQRWLEQRLASGGARWNLLAQGVVMSHIDEDPGAGRRYWTDSWNGYPGARQQLLDFLAARRIANPVVLSGDIHTFMAGSLHRTADDPTSPAVATELVTTSITSQGMPAAAVEAMRAINPNLRFASSAHRGYLRVHLTPERLRADMIGLEDATRRDSPRRTVASFVVEEGVSALTPE